MTRAFSLIEMMAAMVIASVIIAGATGAVITINRAVVDQSRRAAAWDEAKRLEEYLIAMAQGVGGGVVRPFNSILIENAGDPAPPAIPPSTGGNGCRDINGIPDCTDADQGADRFTMLRELGTFPLCAITGTTGVNLNVGAGTNPCCLDDASGGVNSWDGLQALIVGTAGAASVRLNSPNSSGPTCRVVAPPGQGAGVLPTALGSVGFPATLVVVESKTLFVDRAAHELRSWSDTDGDGDATDDEVTLIHDQVYDLQLAAGFDGLPADGRVDDNRDQNDEFLFNHTADALMPGNGNFAAVTRSQLSLVHIAIAVGVPVGMGSGNEVQLLDRATPVAQPGIYLTQTSSKAFLRNLAVFTQ